MATRIYIFSSNIIIESLEKVKLGRFCWSVKLQLDLKFSKKSERFLSVHLKVNTPILLFQSK
jgi:hypothetical protein